MDVAHSTVRVHPNTLGIVFFLTLSSFVLLIFLAFIVVSIKLLIECVMPTRQWFIDNLDYLQG